MAPVAPPAPRLESQFAATIGELKRRMDRQSQLYLQQEEPRHAALLLEAHNKMAGDHADKQRSGGDAWSDHQKGCMSLAGPDPPDPGRRRNLETGDAVCTTALTSSGAQLRPETPPGTPPSELLVEEFTSREQTRLPESGPEPALARSGTITIRTLKRGGCGPATGLVAACSQATPSSIRGRPARPNESPKPSPPPVLRALPSRSGAGRPRPGSAKALAEVRVTALGQLGARSLTARPSYDARVRAGSPRIPSQATFVKQTAAVRPLRPSLLELPVVVLLRLFAFLGPRERTLAVSKRWVDLGLRGDLWASIAFDARGGAGALCRRLTFARRLQRLHVVDRDDVNLLLETALRHCPELQCVRLERCRGPGEVTHCGTFVPRSVVILDTPVSNQLVNLLANVVAGMDECTLAVNVEQAALLFSSLLKMALVADGDAPEHLKSLNVSFGPSASKNNYSLCENSNQFGGYFQWKREGLIGATSYNRVNLTTTFTEVNNVL